MSPTEQMYREKTNAELKELLEVFELSTPNAKNPAKPNKDEMVFALMKFKRHQDKINGIEPEEGDVDPETVSDEEHDEDGYDEVSNSPVRKKRMTKAESIALMKADLFRMERVIVHDTQTSQTPVQALTIAWGNRFVGVQQDVIKFGTPWYLRRGAIKNLEISDITEYIQDEENQSTMNTVTRKRYQVTYLEGWTDDEMAIKAQDQKIRNSRTF